MFIRKTVLIGIFVVGLSMLTISCSEKNEEETEEEEIVEIVQVRGEDTPEQEQDPLLSETSETEERVSAEDEGLELVEEGSLDSSEEREAKPSMLLQLLAPPVEDGGSYKVAEAPPLPPVQPAHIGLPTLQEQQKGLTQLVVLWGSVQGLMKDQLQALNEIRI